MRAVIVTAVVAAAAASIAAQPTAVEAPTGFDAKTNGMVDQTTYDADKAVFDEVEDAAGGLGPVYNAQSCRECHQDPISGCASQVSELRVGHNDAQGNFVAPDIAINGGQETIKARSLVNDRALCPAVHEYTPDTETVRTTRISLPVLGDGFIEAIPDQTLINLARNQCKDSSGSICGMPLRVPIVEAAAGTTGIGR